MVCGRPFSESEKSSLVRSGTSSPFLLRTVANTLTTFTSVEKVGSSCWAGRGGGTPSGAAEESKNRRRFIAASSPPPGLGAIAEARHPLEQLRVIFGVDFIIDVPDPLVVAFRGNYASREHNALKFPVMIHLVIIFRL